jgi:hypothetical protein
MCPACLRVAGGSGRNDGSSHAHRRLPRGTPCHLRPSRLPRAASTFLISWPRSRTRAIDAGGGIRWPGCSLSGSRAVAAGARSFAAIGQWAADAGPEVLAGLGAARGPADEFTFRRAFGLVSPDVLDRVLGAWMHTRASLAGGRLGSPSTARRSAARRTSRERPRTWSPRSPTASARSSGRSPWTRNRTRFPRCGNCSERSPAWPGRSSPSMPCTRSMTLRRSSSPARPTT